MPASPLLLVAVGLSVIAPVGGEPAPSLKKRVVTQGSRQQTLSFPRVFRDGGTTYLSFSVSQDYMNGPESEYRSLKTTDGGRTWHPAGDFNYASALRAGRRLIALQRGFASGHLTLFVNGARTTGSIRYQGALKPGAAAIFDSPVLKVGPRYYATFYAKFARYAHGFPSACLASSTDGIHWTQKSTIANPARLRRGTYVVFSEASLVRLGNGRLYTVIRTDELTPSRPPVRVRLWALRQSYSTNLGRTWSRPQILRTAGGRSVSSHAAPNLLMVGKTLYMAHGRPDNYVSRAPTLSGGLPSFLPQRLVYSNRQIRGLWAHGSSGYSALATLPGGVFTFVDRCAATWGCPATGRFTDAGTPAILMIPAN